MNNYIGFKLIEAEPMDLYTFRELTNKIQDYTEDNQSGYKVVYSDGYISWSPTKVFEAAYMKVTPNLALRSGVSISQQMVDDFIKDFEIITMGEKNTVVRATLANGFELVESSACVDPVNYDEHLGAAICLDKIKDKVWFLLGFLLQTAVNGVKMKPKPVGLTYDE